MKKFTKLVLATSVAFSANAMAMQAMDDASLSETTGQDGISIGIGISKIEIEKLYIHDNSGLDANKTTKSVKLDVTNPLNPKSVFETKQWDTGVKDSTGAPVYRDVQALAYESKSAGGTDKAGALAIYGNGEAGHVNEKHGVVIGANYDEGGKYLLASRNIMDLKIDSDAGNNNPFINIAAEVSGLDIHIGKIGVVASGQEGTGDNSGSIRRGGVGAVNEILTGLSVKTGPMSANIQLGAAPQGAMIKLNATMIGGLEIKDLGIVDNSTLGATVVPAALSPTQADIKTTKAGVIHIDSIKLSDAGTTDLTLNQNISIFGESAANKGFLRIVSNSGAHDTYVKGIHLGSKTAASIGDMEVQGMQTYYSPAQGTYLPGAVITISGH